MLRVPDGPPMSNITGGVLDLSLKSLSARVGRWISPPRGWAAEKKVGREKSFSKKARRPWSGPRLPSHQHPEREPAGPAASIVD